MALLSFTSQGPPAASGAAGSTVLTLNAGSTSLRVSSWGIRPGGGSASAAARWRAALRDTSQGSSFSLDGADAVPVDAGHRRAGGDGPVALRQSARKRAEAVLDLLEEPIMRSPGGVAVVAHRFVASGSLPTGPASIDADLLDGLEEAVSLAPLHQPAALGTLEAARVRFPGVPQVAVFDTDFHAELPPAARAYAVPREMAARHGLVRHGAHGLAHRCMAERLIAIRRFRTGHAPHRVVTIQLGGGCSACAVLDGRSVDTTMGLTPAEGLVMATRSGDVDPTLVSRVAEREGVPAAGVVHRLLTRSGLMGLSGVTGDAGELVRLEEAGGEHADAAAFALDVYALRVRRAIGAGAAVLGGLDGIAFGGGVGEHVHAVRARILRGLGFLGLDLDPAANAAATGGEARIDAGGPVAVHVLAVDEESLLARSAAPFFLQT